MMASSGLLLLLLASQGGCVPATSWLKNVPARSAISPQPASLPAISPKSLATVLTVLEGQAGTVLLPTDSDFESRRQVMNAACTAQPAVIVVPLTEEDVSVAVRAASQGGLPLSVRSGGHSYTCTNLAEGGIHLDMRMMDQIELQQDSSSPTGLAAILGPGALWGDVLRAIPTTSYSYPHGQCRSVGVAGYLLGGGVNWLGTYNKYGYGAENVLSLRVVLADGSTAEVTPEKTEVLSPTARTVPHTSSNNLFFALRGAGSSYGVVTQFKYIVHDTPETKPAILLAWADTAADLEAIKTAGQDSPNYSITISLEYAQDFWQNPLAGPIYKSLFPLVMGVFRTVGRLLYGTDSYPVFLTVTDIRPAAARTTDVISAVDHVKTAGVRLVFKRNIAHLLFHTFGEILYEANIVEQEKWQPGEYFLSSLNFGSLSSHEGFQEIFFNDPAFGNKRANFLESVEDGCDYCFWMIHYRNRQSQTAISLNSPISTERAENNPNSLDTNLVCMFKDGSSSCPALVARVKAAIDAKVTTVDPGYTKYANFPSCSASDWAERYWGGSVTRLENIKEAWDPDHLFNHCQSIGSTSASGQTCCPFSSTSSPITTGTGTTSSCSTASGQACVFPFIYAGQTHTACTLSGFPSPWCSTQTDASGQHVQGSYTDCGADCPTEQACLTTSGAKPNQPCIFPFIYNNNRYTGCTTAPPGDRPWCSTATDNSGNHITGNWGDCDTSACPMA